MEPFLKQAAEEIYKSGHHDVKKICILFPNNRSRLFFRKYYGEVAGKASWSPDIFTITEFIQRIAKLTVADNISLIFDLYEAFKKVFAADSKNNYLQSFERFYSLGEILLNDINDIDSHLVDASQLFRNLSDLREIDLVFETLTTEHKEILKFFWAALSIDNLSAEKQRFLELWLHLPSVYEEFKNSQLQQHNGYEGLVYRHAAEKALHGELDLQRYEHVYIVGFNALNKAEEIIFNVINKKGIARFLWDADNYYIQDEKQEAGFFIRKYIRQYSSQNTQFVFQDFILTSGKTIDLMGVPLDLGQAKAIPQLMKLFGENAEVYEKTAIVLADENMLFPVLYSLPHDIQAINVTMGFPLKDTALFSLIEQYLYLHRFIRRSKESQISYYFKDIIKLLRHPYISVHTKVKGERLIHYITDNNLIYVDAISCLQEQDELLGLLFIPVTDGNELLTQILNIMYQLYTRSLAGNQSQILDVEGEFIYQTYLQVKRLREVINQKTENTSLELNLIIRLVKNVLLQARIPFTGEPLAGLQIMGIMETRNLDFENIILLNANEGSLPKVSRTPSFIPENIRYISGLPVVKQQDSIFAYLFYRLLQRAHKITILYNNISVDNKSGELSRFVQQLIHESNLDIRRKQFRQKLIPAIVKPIKVLKTGEVLKSLEKYIIKDGNCLERLSSTSANTYVDCTLKFYFRYITKLETPRTMTEEVDHATMGTILHSAITFVYSNFITHKQDKKILSDDFKRIKEEIDGATDLAFRAFYLKNTGKNFVYEGTHLILREVIKKYLTAILKVDKKNTPFEIIDLEGTKNYYAAFEVPNQGHPFTVGLYGKFDRIDKIGQIYRIVDYKTGKIDKKFKDVNSLFNSEMDDRRKEIFQLFFYSFIYLQQFQNTNLPLVPAIYDIIEMYRDDFSPNIIQSQNRTSMEVSVDNFQLFLSEYVSEMQQMLADLFNPEIPFTQTSNIEKCQYCDFAVICNRNS